MHGHVRTGSDSSPQTLDLSDQKLQVLPDLQLCKRLTELKLDKNQLSTFGKLPVGLVSLSARGNKVAFVGNLEPVSQSLQVLDLTSNRLISLEGISKCVHLTELYLGHNYVGDDQIHILASLLSLRVLDISHNHLRDNSVLQYIHGMHLLEVFNASANDFSACEFDTPIPSLKFLMLDDNKLQKVRFRGAFRSLTHLSCRENNLVEVEGLEYVPKLEEAYFDGNEVAEVGEEWNELKALQTFSLSFNRIERVTQLKLPLLRRLNVSHNKLKSLSFVSDCKLLAELQASYNEVKTLFSAQLPDLQLLWIAHNQLRSLQGLELAPRLQLLHAGFNQLRSLTRLMTELKGTPLIVNLSLVGNPLTQLFYPDLEQLPDPTKEPNFGLQDYEEVCPLDNESREQRTTYRASLICQYGTTIQVLDCLKVSDMEIEEALALERRGEFVPLSSPSSSLESSHLVDSRRKDALRSFASPTNMTYSLETSSADVSRPSLQPSAPIQITDKHTRQLSATKLTFPPPLDDDPLESSIEPAPRNSAVSSASASFTITPESQFRTSRMPGTPDELPAHFNSIMSVESSALTPEEINISRLKFHSSPDDRMHLLTSNLNSPDLTPQSSQRIDLKVPSRDEIPLQNTHSRSRSMPHNKLKSTQLLEESKRAKLNRSPLSEGAANMFNHTLNPKDLSYDASPTSLAKQFFAQGSREELAGSPGNSMAAISEHSEDLSEGAAELFFPDKREETGSIVCESVNPLMDDKGRDGPASIFTSSTREKIKEKEHELSEKIKRISEKAKELEFDPVRTYESIQEVLESEQHSLQASGRYGVDREFRDAYEERLRKMKSELKVRYAEYKKMLKIAQMEGKMGLGDSYTLRKLSIDLAAAANPPPYPETYQPVPRPASRDSKREESSKHHHHCCRHRHRHHHGHGEKRLRSVPLQTDNGVKENLGPVRVITLREACTSPKQAEEVRPLQERKTVREVATSPQRPFDRVEAATSPPKASALPPRPQSKTHAKGSMDEIRTDTSSLRSYSNEGLRKEASVSSLGSELRTIEELPPISSRIPTEGSECSYVNTLEDEEFGAAFAPNHANEALTSPHFNSAAIKARTTPVRLRTDLAARSTPQRPPSRTDSLSGSFDRPNFCRTPESQTVSGCMESFTLRDRRSVVEYMEQLVVYACTPSRPILNSEAASPIQCQLSPKGSEFSLISQLLENTSRCRIQSIRKTYTYLQQRTLHNLCTGSDLPDSYFLNRESASSGLQVLFHGGALNMLDELCSRAQGFKEVYAGKPGDLIFSDSADIGDRYFYKNQLSGGAQLEGKRWRVLLALVALGKCYQETEAFETVARAGETYIARMRAGDYQSVYFQPNRIYLLVYPDRAVPAYLVEYRRL